MKKINLEKISAALLLVSCLSMGLAFLNAEPLVKRSIAKESTLSDNVAKYIRAVKKLK